MLSDWELWACANQLVEQHGQGAPLEAMTRIFELGEAGDKDGHIAWCMIAERVRKLLREKPAPGEAVQ
jgi:hypothetical protein